MLECGKLGVGMKVGMPTTDDNDGDLVKWDSCAITVL